MWESYRLTIFWIISSSSNGKSAEVIKTASHIGVGMCYCRHKMEHLGKACEAPMDICMTFNTTAKSLTKHGHARTIDKSE